MQRAAADHRALSLRLSRVLRDVGISQDVVLRRRLTYVLDETLGTIGRKVAGLDTDKYVFGSQSEGTTSPGLGSDVDQLHCMNPFNICQDWGEWQQGQGNALIIKDQTTGPGYCRLQYLRSDVPLPQTELPDWGGKQYCTLDDNGRVLVRNTIHYDTARSTLRNFTGKEGPASSVVPGQGFMDIDYVDAYPCSSWPHEARKWLVKERRHWPTAELIQQAESNGCFVVSKGQKMSEFEFLEWRISTSLTERTLMFSMNITQVQCYFALKVIIKTFVNEPLGKCVSSYHLKTVVFYCIEFTSHAMWTEEHLFDCIRHCLQQLRSYLIAGHLPNYFIPEDNLLTSRNIMFLRNKIVHILENMLKSREEFLYAIRVDNIGQRLQMYMYGVRVTGDLSSHLLCMEIHKQLALNLYGIICNTINIMYYQTASSMDRFRGVLSILGSLPGHGTPSQRSAVRFILPSLCSSLGSMIAASDIAHGRNLSPDVTTLFQYGVQSDAASSRLKLASILYCRGEFRRAAELLRDIERRMGRSEVQPICGCHAFRCDFETLKERFSTCSFDALESHFRQNLAYCVIFLPIEFHCMPFDVRFEMFRSFREDRQVRGEMDWWMDWAVIDSLPFLHYLQYHVYKQLGSRDLQQTALQNLRADIVREHNLGHRETALNLLGKCLEQENRFVEAHACFAASLGIRPRNNIANFHISALIYRFYRMHVASQT